MLSLLVTSFLPVLESRDYESQTGEREREREREKIYKMGFLKVKSRLDKKSQNGGD